MTTRTATIVMLFFAGLFTAAVTLPLAVALATRSGAAPGVWLAPVAALVSFVAVFFAGRSVVLPVAIVRSPWRAMAVITLWIAGAIGVAVVAGWMLAPVLTRVNISQGTFVIVLACVLLAAAPVERFAPRERTPA